MPDAGDLLADDLVVVVGASLAGLRAVETLRREGFDGRLTLVGAEPHLPYDRPPLSKELLAGEWEPDQIALRKQPYDELDARSAARAARRAPRRRRPRASSSTAASGSPFDGRRHRHRVDAPRAARARPRSRHLHAPHARRRLAIRAELERGPRSSWSAPASSAARSPATCRERGLEVTVLEALPVPLVRGLGPVLGGVLGDLHRDHGVDLRCSAAVEGFEGRRPGRAGAPRRRTAIDADVVVVGVGVVPETRWLEGSGLTLDNGVVCDATCLAAPGVVAAGDVARWPNPLFDGAVDAPRALDERDRAGRARRARAARRRRRRAVRAGAVRVVGPVRREDPDGRRRRGRRRHRDRRTVRSRSAASSRSSVGRAGSSARSGSAGPGW